MTGHKFHLVEGWRVGYLHRTKENSVAAFSELNNEFRTYLDTGRGDVDTRNSVEIATVASSLTRDKLLQLVTSVHSIRSVIRYLSAFSMEEILVALKEPYYRLSLVFLAALFVLLFVQLLFL